MAYSLTSINSCETITITKADGANDATASADVTKAEIVYFAGGVNRMRVCGIDIIDMIYS